MNRILIIICLVTLSGCQGPLGFGSGGELAGQEVIVDDWSIAEGEYIYQVEVRPEDPYSVNLRVILIDGNLYIDAAERRRWHDHLKEDPRLRVRFGDKIVKAVAVLETDENIKARFSEERTVYRLERRQWRAL